MMPRAAYLWAVLPLAPFALGLILLEFLHGSGLPPFTLPSATHAPLTALSFFNSLIIFASVGFIHVIFCVAAVIYFVLTIRRLGLAERRQVWVIAGILLVLLCVINLAARIQDVPGALNLTYRSVCDIVHSADVFRHLLPPTCTAPGVSAFAWLAVLPYVFGLAAALVGGAVTSLAARAMDDARKSEVSALIERVFQVAVMVLVTSTAAMMLFYQLPLSVLDEPQAVGAVQSFGRAITMFWGSVFTLTLLATFGPALVFLSGPALATQAQTTEARVPTVFQATRKQLSRLLAILAPFIVGSLGSIFDQVAGAI